MSDTPKQMRTWSLIATEAEFEKLYADLAKCGWRLRYQGHSGHWLGEPIYEVRNLGQDVKESKDSKG